MKILHAPTQIAGQMGILCKGLRKQGVDATSLNLYPNKFNFSGDITVDINSYPSFLRGLALYSNFLKFLSYDIYHFHFWDTLLPYNRDLPLLKYLKKKIVFHFHGCDIRNKERAMQWFPFHGCQNHEHCEKRQKLIIKKAFKYADKILVSTPDLLEFVAPRGEYLPIVIDDVPTIENHQKTIHDELSVVHATSDRKMKGTEHIINAVEELRKDGLPIKLTLLENMSHDKVLLSIRQSDIAVDQLLSGWYGTFGIENLSLGKPVIAYIHHDFLKFAPNVPVIDASPYNISEVLKHYILNRNELIRIGRESRQFYLSYHSTEKVVSKLINIYEQLLN